MFFSAHRLEIDAEAFGAREQQTEFFVEYEQSAALAATRRPREIVEREQRFAGPGRADDQRARPGSDAAAEQLVEPGNPAVHDLARKSRAMIGGDQSGKHGDAAGLDVEVVVAAAKTLAAALDDAQPPPFAAVDRRQLVEMDHAVRDAVNGAIGALGGEIVEHDDGRIMLREIMLQRENLPPVAQRALRQQTDFREAVDDDPLGL